MNGYILSGRQANLYGLLFVVPAILLAGIPYILIWCEFGNGWAYNLLAVLSQNTAIIQMVIHNSLWLFLVPLAIIAGVVMHELIHGICMAAFAKDGWKSVSFGFNVKAFAPYAHCKEPLTPNAYRFSLVMPGILLGDIPVLIGWFTGNILFLAFGILFYWAASGDVILLWMSRKITGGMIQDHPDKIGFIHIEST
jgi:hypothetical protein